MDLDDYLMGLLLLANELVSEGYGGVRKTLNFYEFQQTMIHPFSSDIVS